MRFCGWNHEELRRSGGGIVTASFPPLAPDAAFRAPGGAEARLLGAAAVPIRPTRRAPLNPSARSPRRRTRRRPAVPANGASRHCRG
ncbi:hypothetical protein ACFPRL_22600 [Pseudoclavibacter helvolus]